MAQNGKLSQDVGSEEGYRRQLSMHKIAAMKKTVLTVAVVAAAAVGLVLFIEKRSYRTYDIIQTSEQEDIVSTKYEVMSGKILRYSPDGAALVNSEMDAYWSSLYEMQNPVADIRGDWAVIADVDGTSMKIFDKDGEVGSVTTSYSIVKALSLIHI